MRLEHLLSGVVYHFGLYEVWNKVWMYVIPLAFRLLDIMGIAPPACYVCQGGGETFRGRPAMDGTASPIAQLVRAPH